MALESPLEPTPLLRALNGIAPDLFFTHARPIELGFRPRAARGREYRYFEPAEGRDPAEWRHILGEFVGRVDARSFGRGLDPTAPVWRDISSTEVTVENGWLVLHVLGRSFVWGMVRKMVAGVREVVEGRLEAEVLRAAIAGDRPLSLPLAPPERLVLWEVEYDVPWGSVVVPPTPRRRQEAAEARRGAAARATILDALWDWFPAENANGHRPL